MGEMWSRVVASAPVPPQVVVVTGIIALLLVLDSSTWQVVSHASTLVHEGAHGLAAVLVGARVRAIHLRSDTSGSISWHHGASTGRPAEIVVAAAGYVGPSLLGLGAAGLLAAGYASGLLWAILVLLVLLLTRIRNWFGILSVLLTGGIVFVGVRWLPDQLQASLACLIVWLLLLSGPRDVIGLQRVRRRSPTADTDADNLAELTRLPGLLWVVVFFAVTVGALAVGAWWLLF